MWLGGKDRLVRIGLGRGSQEDPGRPISSARADLCQAAGLLAALGSGDKGERAPPLDPRVRDAQPQSRAAAQTQEGGKAVFLTNHPPFPNRENHNVKVQVPPRQLPPTHKGTLLEEPIDASCR